MNSFHKTSKNLKDFHHGYSRLEWRKLVAKLVVRYSKDEGNTNKGIIIIIVITQEGTMIIFWEVMVDTQEQNIEEEHVRVSTNIPTNTVSVNVDNKDRPILISLTVLKKTIY